MPLKFARHMFCIQNQGPYDSTGAKKQEFLDYIQSQYPNLKEYLIAQELCLNDNVKKDYVDTHLQGILIFKNDVHKSAILKHIQRKYTPPGQESIGRVDIRQVEKINACQHYFKMENKEGKDDNYLSNMLGALDREGERLYNAEVKQLMQYYYDTALEHYENNLKIRSLNIHAWRIK